MLCKELAGCGKLKFCFLRLFFSFIYFQSMVGWIRRCRTHGYGGRTLCVCVCVCVYTHIYITHKYTYIQTRNTPPPLPCFFKQLLFRKFAAPFSDPESTFWGHTAEPCVDNPHVVPIPLPWKGKHTHTTFTVAFALAAVLSTAVLIYPQSRPPSIR